MNDLTDAMSDMSGKKVKWTVARGEGEHTWELSTGEYSSKAAAFESIEETVRQCVAHAPRRAPSPPTRRTVLESPPCGVRPPTAARAVLTSALTTGTPRPSSPRPTRTSRRARCSSATSGP